MRQRTLLVLLAVLFCGIQATAQSPFSISGVLRSGNAVFTRDWKTAAFSDNLLRMDLNAQRGKVSAYTRIEFWYDGLRSTHGVEDNPFDTPLREFQIYFPVGPVDIRAGKQLILWGTADELNPTDVINPENYYRFALPEKSERKIPTLSVKADWYSSFGTFTGVFVPFFTPDKLPAPGDPWEVPLLDSLKEIQPAIYSRLDGVNSDWRTGHPQFAVKYGNSAWNTDFSISFYDGVSPMPAFAYDADAGILSLGEVNPYYLEYQMYGADFQSALGAFTLRGEFAYYTQQYFQSTTEIFGMEFPLGIESEPQLYGILGIDRFFGQTWYVNLQAGVDHIANYEESIIRDQTWYLGSALVRKSFFRDRLLAEGAIYGNFINQDYFTRMTITYKMQDILHLSLFGNLIGSDSREFIGQYKNHDVVGLRLEYFF